MRARSRGRCSLSLGAIRLKALCRPFFWEALQPLCFFPRHLCIAVSRAVSATCCVLPRDCAFPALCLRRSTPLRMRPWRASRCWEAPTSFSRGGVRGGSMRSAAVVRSWPKEGCAPGLRNRPRPRGSMRSAPRRRWHAVGVRKRGDDSRTAGDAVRAASARGSGGWRW